MPLFFVSSSTQECRITALTPAQPNKLEKGRRATESNDTQVTTHAPIANPASNSYPLCFGWNALALLQPWTDRTLAATPAAAGSIVRLFGAGQIAPPVRIFIR